MVAVLLSALLIYCASKLHQYMCNFDAQYVNDDAVVQLKPDRGHTEKIKYQPDLTAPRNNSSHEAGLKL